MSVIRYAGFVVCFLVLISLALLAQADHPYSGGETTVVIPKEQMADRGAFSRPATNLSMIRRGDFFAGNSFFQNAWVTAPASTKARDGLGPLFNTMSCQSCHIKDGRGRPPLADQEMVSMILRISRENPDKLDSWKSIGVKPDPAYGTQIQPKAIHGIQAEATPRMQWEEIKGTFADGSSYSLRKPIYQLDQPNYGPFPKDLMVSGRVAPALIGVGLLDTIAPESIRKLEDPNDEDGDGISGRSNLVWNATEQKFQPGRFGWKAEQPNIRQQVAAAFSEDIGITSSIFPESALTAQQKKQIDAPNGGVPEVNDEILELVTFYCKTLAVPARRGHTNKVIVEGENLFKSLGCVKCHVDSFTTGNDPNFPELSRQKIHPYTDLLLHDMGEGLADNRPVFEATGREWRTPPLWGIGVIFRVNRHNFLLHDGRARNMEEAILWHGGEAKSSQEAYRRLDRTDRRKLIAFLKSL